MYILLMSLLSGNGRGSLMVQWVVGSILCGVLIELFFVPASAPLLFNKGRGMCYPVSGMVHIKYPLLLIRKSNPYSGGRFPLSLSE